MQNRHAFEALEVDKIREKVNGVKRDNEKGRRIKGMEKGWKSEITSFPGRPCICIEMKPLSFLCNYMSVLLLLLVSCL
jgi:hypothetical protein